MCPSCPASMGRRTAALGIVALRVILLTAMFQAIVANTEHMACPTDCSCLGNMVDCSKKRLKRVPDDLPAWVQILDVSSNSITNVRNDQFKGLNQLEEINLSDNKLTIFNGSVLRHLPAVQNLKLSHNQLSQLPDISWPANITHLILSHNVIVEVNATASLRGNSNVEKNLRVIDLSYNAITQLRNTTLYGLNGLHHLFLMDNKIETIDRGALDNLSSLEWLKLNKNRLTSLPSNVFIRLQKLKYLELNQNRLRKIEGLRFQGLGNLLSLRLRRNQLSELMDGAFWGLSRIETLQLDYNNLSKINSGFLFGLETMEHLSMAHNVINQIEVDSWSSCKRLTELDLSHNHLSAITESMFWRLETLQTLKLNQNRISYIAETAFRDLLALKTLDLNHNQLSSTLEDTNSVFSSLTSLTRFSLDGNNIKSIARHTFRGLHHLKQLNLLANAITSIQDNAFEPLKDLEQLRFNSTSLLCDCHLSWLPIWLRGTGQQVNVVAQCAHPLAIQGQSVLEVDGSNFKCDDFPKPIIVKDPQSQIALKDGTLNLTCTAATSSDSQLKIDWKKDHLVLNNALVENTARSNAKSGLVEYTSHLVVRPVKNEHAGHYQCIVSNALGTSYSAKAEITVGVFPRFLKTPSDVTVKAGSTARLECAASGQPTPEIAWQKDGGDDFPAARERRMHVMPSDDVFFIVEVKSDDQGIYTCTAKNDAGFVKANSTLVVLRAPSFAKTSREKIATEGETAVLECMSSRIGGRPRLDWLKEGQPLFVTSRHFFAAEGQLLIIVNAQPSDSGEYTCIMTNSLGSERATSHFSVVGLSSLGEKSYVAESNQGDDMTRVGIIVIAVVVCVVGTSLVWVIIIYRLRLKREEYGSTTTDETTLPGEIPSSPFHANEDGSSSITGQRSSPVLWTNAGHSVTVEDYSSVMCGTKRLLSDPTQKCSPSADFYLYNSCRCHQDSGCFCTDSNKSNEKSSHSHNLTEVGNDADRLRKCRLPPVKNCRRHSTVSMPDPIKTANVRASIKDAYRSLEVGRPVAEAPPSADDSVCINTCTGWHTASDTDLSSAAGNQCRLCTNKCPVSCQASQEAQVAMPCHLHETIRSGPPFENCWHTLEPPSAVASCSCQSDCLHKQLATEALPASSVGHRDH